MYYVVSLYVISTSFRRLPPSLVGKYVAFVDSLTCSPPYSYIIFLHWRSRCFSVFIGQWDDHMWCYITGTAKVFDALTFRGIDMLLDHITVSRFKNSSLTSSQTISSSSSYILLSSFPRKLIYLFCQVFLVVRRSVEVYVCRLYYFSSNNVHGSALVKVPIKSLCLGTCLLTFFFFFFFV